MNIESLFCPACGQTGLIWKDIRVHCSQCHHEIPVISKPGSQGVTLDFSAEAVGPGDIGYNNADMDWIHSYLKFEETHFWAVNRNRFLADILKNNLPNGASVCDVGCGLGKNVSEFSRLGFNVVGVEGVREIAVAGTAYRPTVIVWSDITNSPILGRFDGVCAFDVIEHIRDDVGALRRFGTMLRPQGRIFLTVPALQSLWSSSDVAGGHIRRYSKKTLEAVILEANLDIVRTGYFMGATLPALYLSRTMHRFTRPDIAVKKQHATELNPPEWVNKLFFRITSFEMRYWENGLPLGTSLFAVLRKPA